MDADPGLARIRQELVWRFGEEIAFAIRLTGADQAPFGSPAWDPQPSYEALEHIDALLSERPALRTPIRIEVQPAAEGRWLVYTWDP